jgi:hypothetical protein
LFNQIEISLQFLTQLWPKPTVINITPKIAIATFTGSGTTSNVSDQLFSTLWLGSPPDLSAINKTQPPFGFIPL